MCKTCTGDQKEYNLITMEENHLGYGGSTNCALKRGATDEGETLHQIGPKGTEQYYEKSTYMLNHWRELSSSYLYGDGN